VNWKVWLIVPLLALLAYVTVLRVGFLSDDFVLLNANAVRGLDLTVFVPSKDWYFYRPVGLVLTWQLGWLVWGFNPLPYHILGLLAHAATSLILGLCLFEFTSNSVLGWLAGLFFAVFPLHSEAVGWVAAQWDVLAVLFVVLSLWLFTRWWRSPKVAWMYVLSLGCFGLAIFSKESVFAFLPVFFLSVTLATPPIFRLRDCVRLILALTPFAGILGTNIALRLLFLGSIGGYATVSASFVNSVTEGTMKYLGILVSPINSDILPRSFATGLTIFVPIAIFVGVLLTFRQWWRVLLMSLVWTLVSLLPVLNLYATSIDSKDLEGNRYLYLSAAGYSIGLGLLGYALLRWAHTSRNWIKAGAFGIVGLFVISSLVLCWIQLLPWHTASVQAVDLNQELLSLVPPQARPNGMVWYAEKLPDTYKGAYVFRQGLGNMRFLTSNPIDTPGIEEVRSISDADLTEETRDAFAFKFRYYSAYNRFSVSHGVGLTRNLTVPASPPGQPSNLELWDFTSCTPNQIDAWQTLGAKTSCQPGTGLVIEPGSSDPQLISPQLHLDIANSTGRFLRMRVAATYSDIPAGSASAPLVSEWFWAGDDLQWSPQHSSHLNVRLDNVPIVYWTFLSRDDVSDPITRLRFDPINANVQTIIRWIAIEIVE
jgi:hypothetical protein